MIPIIYIALFAALAQAQEAEKPVAILDGKPLTQTEINMLSITMNQKVVEAAGPNLQQALRYYAFLKRLTAMAEKENLPAQSPYKEKLEMMRYEVLANAMMEHYKSRLLVMPDDQKKYYDENPDEYRVGKFRIIYLPFTTTLEEEQALHKAEELQKRAQAGEDFLELLKAHSKDKESVDAGGVFGPVNRSDQRHAEHIRAAIFALKVGEVSKPIRNPNGYYVFKCEDLSLQPYAQVKDEIFTMLLDRRFQKWLADVNQSIEVKILPK